MTDDQIAAHEESGMEFHVPHDPAAEITYCNVCDCWISRSVVNPNLWLEETRPPKNRKAPKRAGSGK